METGVERLPFLASVPIMTENGLWVERWLGAGFAFEVRLTFLLGVRRRGVSLASHLGS
jgi:hypothetical protein